MDKPLIKSLKKNQDDRGWVIEILRSNWLPKRLHEFGQLYISKGVQGKVKGEHYHSRKREWFMIADGNVIFRWKNLDSGEGTDILLNANDPKLLEVPPGIAHSFFGESDFLLIAYVNEAYDSENPDTFAYHLFGNSE